MTPTREESFPEEDERKVRGAVIVATPTSAGNYSAGSIDFFRFGDIKHALARGDIVELPDPQGRKITVKIEMHGLPADLAARSGVWTSQGQRGHGDEVTLPLSEAIELARSRRAVGVGDSALAQFLSVCGRRPLTGPSSAPMPHR